MSRKARSVQLAQEAGKNGEGEMSPEVGCESRIGHCGGDRGGRASTEKTETEGGADATGPACRNNFPAGGPVDHMGAAGAPVHHAGLYFWSRPGEVAWA